MSMHIVSSCLLSCMLSVTKVCPIKHICRRDNEKGKNMLSCPTRGNTRIGIVPLEHEGTLNNEGCTNQVLYISCFFQWQQPSKPSISSWGLNHQMTVEMPECSSGIWSNSTWNITQKVQKSCCNMLHKRGKVRSRSIALDLAFLGTSHGNSTQS